MNRYQLGVLLSTFAVIGLAVFVYTRPQRRPQPLHSPLGLLAIPLWLAALITGPLTGILYGIALLGRLTGHEALIRKQIDMVVGPIIFWVCFILLTGGIVGGLVWMVVDIVRGG